MSQANLVGTRFTQYEIQAEIGHGPASVVYRALQPSVNRQVAIKMLAPAIAGEADFIERFKREMNVLAGLEHFNIESIYEAGVEKHTPYIVMRYLAGGSLVDVLERQKKLPIDVTVALANQIAAALDFAHSRGTVHRNLKPSNILFDSQGNAYVSDFGLNWLLESASAISGSGVIGTAAYISPEAAGGMRDVSPANDIYALGVILFETLTGQPPFSAPSAIKLAMKHLNDTPPAPRSLDRGLPRAIDPVFAKALAKRPEDRYRTAGDLATALVEATGVGPAPALTVNLDGALSTAETLVPPRPGQEPRQEPQQARRPARRANEWLMFSIVATLLGLGILVVGGFLASQILGRVNSPGGPAGGAATQPAEVTAQPSVAQSAIPTPTSGGAATSEPTAAPITSLLGGGGGKIAYISERSGNPEVYILDLASNALVQVTRNTGTNSQLAWSPDGQQLAYISDRAKDSPNIFVVGVDGQNPKDVTPRDLAQGYPLWLPGTHTLAFYVLQGEDRMLRKVDTDSGDVQDVILVPSSFKTLLDWTPDRHVIYYGFSRAGNLGIVDVDTATGDRTPITVSGAISFLSYSPDRAKVAFTLMQGRQSQLFVADASCPLVDQCNARRLLTDNASYLTPRFSPDGKDLLVASDRSGNLDLWIFDLDGNLVQKVPGSGLDDYEGVWQP